MRSSLNCENPIFIYGCARSGTSLLSRILNSHPNIAVPYESHLYNIFYPWLKYYGSLDDEKNRRQIIVDMSKILHDWSPGIDPEAAFNATRQHDFHGVIDGVFYSIAQMDNKSRWGEKSPWHVFYWKEILEGFPKAKYIHIVRDGRDSSASWRNARFGPKHFLLLAERWRDYLKTVEKFRASVPKEHILDVRYEDLLANPENIIRQICIFLDEEYSPDMLLFHENKTPYPTDKTNLENLTKPLMQDNTKKWKTNLNQNEIRIFEAIAKQQLEQYNYEVTNKDARISPIEYLYIRFFLHPLLRFKSMAKNTKGQTDEMKKRFIYFKLRMRSLLK